MGELIRPKKEIAEDAGENDHIDDEAAQMIKYIHAPECMQGKTLTQEQGRTHEVFQAAEGEGDEEEEKPEEEMTPEELEAKRAKEAEKARPKHLFIPEVV